MLSEMTTDQAMDCAENFVDNFTSYSPYMRVQCLQLYRRYLEHCQRFQLRMLPKDQFMVCVYNITNELPELSLTTGCQWVRHWNRLVYIGGPGLLSLNESTMALLTEPSELDAPKPGGAEAEASPKQERDER